MKLKLVAVGGLLLVACGGSDRNTQTPSSSASTTSAASDPSVEATTQSRADTSVTRSPSDTSTASASDRTTAAGVGSSDDNTRSNSGNKRTSADPGVVPAPAPAPAAAPGVTVVNNPGAADQTKNADNTKINDRDRHGALTSGDTGGSEAERKNAAAIRRAVVGDKGLSITAKNVKIIVTGSKVTLRGTVKTDQEKSLIAGHAKQAAPGITEVDNQLEVKK